MNEANPSESSPPGAGTAKALTDATLTASRALAGIVARSLASALEHVTLPQFRVLVILESHGAQRVGVLADLVGVHQTTFTRTADRLVKAGWVHRVDNPDNRREVLISLSAEGRRLVRTVTSRRRTELAKILRRLDPAQRAAVELGMRLFAEAAGEPVAGDLLTLGV